MSDAERVDSGIEGFQAIFGEKSESDAPQRDTSTEDASQQTEATSAERASPETPDDGQDLSAEDVIAARLAASLDADGVSVSESGAENEDEEEPVAASAEVPLNLENLTPEQLEQFQSLMAQVEELQAKTTQSSRQEIANKVIAAEQQAVEAVRQEYRQHFKQEVVARSNEHYLAEMMQRASKDWDQADAQPNPKQWYLKQIAGHFLANLDSLRGFEDQSREEIQAVYDQRANEARIAARKQVPELRQLYAEELATEFSLPAQVVVPLLLKVADTDQFRAEAERLAGVRDFAARQTSQANQQKRQQANQELRETGVRTPATARPPGGKLPDYKGNWAEGQRILSLLSNK